MICTKCGFKEVNDRSKFCPQCGHKFGKEEAYEIKNNKNVPNVLSLALSVPYRARYYGLAL